MQTTHREPSGTGAATMNRSLFFSKRKNGIQKKGRVPGPWPLAGDAAPPIRGEPEAGARNPPALGEHDKQRGWSWFSTRGMRRARVDLG